MKLNTLLLLFCVHFVSSYAIGEPIPEKTNMDRCGYLISKNYDYIPISQALYKIHQTAENITDAKAICEKDGASLYYPRNEREFNTIMSYNIMKYKRLVPSDTFLGLERSKEGFVPIDGTPSSNAYINWRQGQPDNPKHGENCVVVSTNDFFMDDYPCSAKFSFICELRLNESKECELIGGKTNISTVDRCNNVKSNNYTYIPENRAFYKLHHTEKNIVYATTTCEEEGASLYYPDTEGESNVVMSYFITNKNKKDVPAEMFLGLLKSEEGFTPIDGNSSSNMYINWRSTNSSNLDNGKNCVNINTTGLFMNEYSCTHKLPFICKLRTNNMNEQCAILNTDGEATEKVISNADRSNALKTKGYVYIPKTEALYKFYQTAKNFNHAKMICEEEGAILYYPDTESESNAVMTYLINKYKQAVPVEMMVGLERSKRGFEPIDGIPSTNVYIKWAKNEPNNAGNAENCVVFRKADLLMADVVCTREFQFICKSRLNEWNEECQISDLDFAYSEEMGKCYKFHLTPKTWTEANEKCIAEQSHLAVINSHEEAAYLVRLTRKALRTIPGRFTHGVVLLGFHNNNVEDWQTLDGTSLYYSGYACWGNSQPDGGDRDRCGSMFYNGHLNDIACDQKAFFICEHNNIALNYVHEPRSFYNVIQSVQCHDSI